jgi:hypothetical protein
VFYLVLKEVKKICKHRVLVVKFVVGSLVLPSKSMLVCLSIKKLEYLIWWKLKNDGGATGSGATGFSFYWLCQVNQIYPNLNLDSLIGLCFEVRWLIKVSVPLQLMLQFVWSYTLCPIVSFLISCEKKKSYPGCLLICLNKTSIKGEQNSIFDCSLYSMFEFV